MPIITAAVLALATVGCSSDGGVLTPDAVTSTAPVTTSTLAPAVTSSTTTTSTTTTSTTTTTLPPTTTTEPIITEGGIVLVANASSVPGAAGRLSSSLADLGFTMSSPVNAAGSDERLPDSRVYARDVNDPVALSIARLMGGVPVLRMPTPVPVESGSAGDATVVVMLGKDLAATGLPDE